MAKITIYDWEFRLLSNGEIESRNVKTGGDWAQREPKDVDIEGSGLWALRGFLNQLNQIFPSVQPHLSKSDPPAETVPPAVVPVGA